MTSPLSYKQRLPVFLGFFIMGFVDVVGISTNYAKKDLELRDSVANLLPFMVFIWFALFSVPTGVLMNRVGRKKTVLIGMGITLGAMGIPFLSYRFETLLVTFALIGIGNTILQVALNPLLTNVVTPRRLTSALTGGQLIKAISSFLGPVIAALASSWTGNWKIIFPFFGGVTLGTAIWLALTSIQEERVNQDSSSWVENGRLLKNPFIGLLFLGVVCIVGLDVGLNTTFPKFLMMRCGLPLERAGLGTSLYFIARTLGSFAGVVLLTKVKNGRFFLISAGTGILFLAGLLFASQLWVLLVLIFGLGLSVANIFPIIFSAALQEVQGQANEVSGLLIMGVSGGAVLLPLMGLIGDAKGPAGALTLLLAAWLYLFFLGTRLNGHGTAPIPPEDFLPD